MTAKEQVREILNEIWAQPDWTSDDPNEMADYQEREVDQALSQIEEIVMGVLGGSSEYNCICEHCSDWDDGRNTLLSEQLNRWSKDD